MTIHNFIRKNSKTYYEFQHYEDENIVEDESGDHICEDQSLSLIATSSREMDLVQDSIKDQIIECMPSN